MLRKALLVFCVVFLLPALLFAQDGKMRGRVTDKESGDPLVGANVTIDGTSLGAAADLRGDYVQSGKKDEVVTLHITDSAKQHYKDDPTVPPCLPIRLLRIDLDNEVTEVLATSLLDAKKYPYEDFQKLYHWRWPIEEGNKSAKHHQYIEKFHRKSRLCNPYRVAAASG